MESTTTEAKMTARHYTYRAEVFDGRGIAHIWTVREYRTGRDEYIECIGTVYGVHTVAEAMEAARAEGII